LIPGSGKLDYRINSPLTNITEFYSKGFNLTIPSDTHQANTTPDMVRIFETITPWGTYSLLQYSHHSYRCTHYTWY
jgi:hypothetical protein